MRTAAQALAWEFWSANRRGWLLLVAAMPVFALLYRLVADSCRELEDIKFFGTLPMVLSLILAGAFCNFTDQVRREGVAGFPRHLFILPISTFHLVTSAILCGVVSVVGIYIAWATLVLRPLDVVLWVRWPATILAVFVVLFQAIVWCLSGFRITRILILSLVATTLVGISSLPLFLPKTNFWASEAVLSTILAAAAVSTYGGALVAVGRQRRGGGAGWTWPSTLVERLAILIPHRRRALKSADSALFWMEWRRAGLLLPAAVLLATCLVLGTTILFTDRGAKATMWAENWLAVLPLIVAAPISMGFGKPDFWSLDVTLSPFIAARPLSGGQLLSAKMKVAAVSTLLAWAALLAVAPLCIYLYCDTEHWHDAWQMLGLIYSPFSQWAVPVLWLVMSMLLTWSLMIGNVWLGYSGRPVVYYAFVVVGMGVFLTALVMFSMYLERPRYWQDAWLRTLTWLPWAFAAFISAKAWFAIWCGGRLRHRGLITHRNITMYSCLWLAAATCLVYRAWLISPGIEWLRNVLMLFALCVIPLARVAATPLAIAWNRHR